MEKRRRKKMKNQIANDNRKWVIYVMITKPEGKHE